MREQIRLWFYSQLFMSVVLVGRSPYRKVLGYEKMLDEHGREMHGSWGNMIDAEDAFARMGADVMRWQYCAQPPDRNLLFGFGPANEIQRKLLTFWNCLSFFVATRTRRASPRAGPTSRRSVAGPRGQTGRAAGARPLATRAHGELVAEAAAGYEQYLTVNVIRAFEAYLDDLSNWYIRRSRRRFWNSDTAALRTLWFALVQSLRVVSPMMPFLADHLWQLLVVDQSQGPRVGLPRRLAQAGQVDEKLVAEIAAVRSVVELGRKVRAQSKLKLRQPLRKLSVEGVSGIEDHLAEIADELRVKEVSLEPIETTGLRVKPNFRVLAPRLGSSMPQVKQALDAGQFTDLDDGRFEVLGFELSPDEVIVERLDKPGFEVASEDGVTVALDTTLDDELRLQSRVYELIHHVNTLRRDTGLGLSDRITLTLPASDKDLLEHSDWIEAEVLADSVELGNSDKVAFEKI